MFSGYGGVTLRLKEADFRSSQLVAIMPVLRNDTGSDSFAGREYLGLYYYVSGGTLQNTTQEGLWIHEDSSTYVLYDKWVLGARPTKH
jgi:hypothetical protein